MGIHWSPELDQILINNRKTMSAALIADIIGNGCTRKAVIGRAHRLKLERLTRTTDAATKPRMTTRKDMRRMLRPLPAPEPFIDAPIDNDIPVEQRKQLIELRPNDCRWPVGEPGKPEFFFCGGDTNGLHSYCPGHRQLARGR